MLAHRAGSARGSPWPNTWIGDACTGPSMSSLPWGVQETDRGAQALERLAYCQVARDADWIRPRRENRDDLPPIESQHSLLHAVVVVIHDVACRVRDKPVLRVKNRRDRVVQEDGRRIDLPRVVAAGQLDVHGDPPSGTSGVHGIRVEVDRCVESLEVLPTLPYRSRERRRIMLRPCLPGVETDPKRTADGQCPRAVVIRDS